MMIEDIPVIELQCMAETAHRAQQFAQAKSIYICLLGVLRHTFARESKELAVNFYKLSEVYADAGDYSASRTMYHRATEIWQALHSDRALSEVEALMEVQAASDELTMIIQSKLRRQRRHGKAS